MITDEQLLRWVREAFSRSIELVDDLSEDELRVPLMPTVNPILWELCHAAYFVEYWVLRQGAGRDACRPDVDELFDSATIAHETRWRLPVPDRAGTLAYVREVVDRVARLIEPGTDDERLRYLLTYAVFHTDMHTEALTYTRQALGYGTPELDVPRVDAVPTGERLGDAAVDGCTLELGAPPDVPFCFDNEKWAHSVRIEPFEISRTAVSEGEFAAFVSDGGYERRELWRPEGWAWRQAAQAELPLFWRRAAHGELEKRHFDRWLPLEERRAVVHVCWYEADAWCRWAQRRLPTEAEWEAAAAMDGSVKRTHPWGERAPESTHCNMDWSSMGPVDVTACPDGDSACGCRQMIGNVWEWTDTTFRPYPGFEPDMYRDYSQTSFDTRKVLRGGSWATRSRMIRNTWRNYFQPVRRDVFAGFRTCAAE